LHAGDASQMAVSSAAAAQRCIAAYLPLGLGAGRSDCRETMRFCFHNRVP
jgi:hypothetical protein